MKFNIDKFIHRPSFYFLAYQGFLIFLAYLTTFIIYVYFRYDELLVFESLAYLFDTFLCFLLMYPILWLIIELPYITLCSLITYAFWSFIKNRNVLFSIPLILINVILLSIAPYSDAYQRSNEANGIAFGAIFTAPFIPLVAILFTIIPYLVLRYREKKYNLVVENPPFAKNKLLLTSSIIGIIICLASYIGCSFIWYEYLSSEIFKAIFW